MSTAAGTVSVTFIDSSTGHAFARSDLPAAALPASFAPETTLHLGDDPWLVERAEPPTTVEALTIGRLVLTVRRLQSVPADKILYSLPTICETLPAVSPTPVTTGSLELHEDDWRQVELVSRRLTATVDTELAAIRRVYEDDSQRDADGRIVAFRKIHTRSIIPLADPLSWPRLQGLLPAPPHEYAGVRFRRSAVVVVGSFALGFGPLTCYGITDQSRVTVLGLNLTTDSGSIPVAPVEAVLRAFDLVIVDWCRCTVIEPGRLADYFQAAAPPNGTVN
jgi:hypothetical protein